MTPKEQALAAVEIATRQKANAAISAHIAQDYARLAKGDTVKTHALSHAADARRYATQAAAAYAKISTELDAVEEFAVECGDYHLCARLAQATEYERDARQSANVATFAAEAAEAAAARL